MTTWQDYDKSPHTVIGTLKVYPSLYSPQLHNSRDILVWLPPSYSYSNQHYKVIYMHDGQNLFDQHTSFVGEWQVDETLTLLAAEGIEAIVVGIPNIGQRRIVEYSPFDDSWFGKGYGTAYLAFLIDTVKPLIDAEFRTLADPTNTGIIGSSLGGLISLYAAFTTPTFGFAGVMSPHLFIGNRAIFDLVRKARRQPATRIYLDVGTREHRLMRGENAAKEAKLSRRFLHAVREMSHILAEKGFVDGQTLHYIEDEGAEHNEQVWARRLPGALRFLLT